MEKEVLFDKIERYLQGKMPEEEVSDFEREIAANPELAEQVEMQRFELESLEFILEEDLRQKFSEWKTDSHSSGTSDPPGKKRRWWLPLLVALLGLTGIWFFWPPTPTQLPVEDATPTESEPAAPQPNQKEAPAANQEQPAEQQPEKKTPQNSPIASLTYEQGYYEDMLAYYELPSNMQNEMQRSTSTSVSDNPITTGIAAFRLDSLDKAVAFFKEIPAVPDTSKYALAQKWLAHVYIEKKEFEKAAAIFKNTVENSSNQRVKGTAEWYYLLCLVPNYSRHKKEVDELLNKMTAPERDHGFKDKASDLQQRLSQKK